MDITLIQVLYSIQHPASSTLSFILNGFPGRIRTCGNYSVFYSWAYRPHNCGSIFLHVGINTSSLSFRPIPDVCFKSSPWAVLTRHNLFKVSPVDLTSLGVGCCPAHQSYHSVQGCCNVCYGIQCMFFIQFHYCNYLLQAQIYWIIHPYKSQMLYDSLSHMFCWLDKLIKPQIVYECHLRAFYITKYFWLLLPEWFRVQNAPMINILNWLLNALIGLETLLVSTYFIGRILDRYSVVIHIHTTDNGSCYHFTEIPNVHQLIS